MEDQENREENTALEAPPEKKQCLESEKKEFQVMKKRNNYLQWDEYFMAVAFLSAQRSKDPRSQVTRWREHYIEYLCPLRLEHVLLIRRKRLLASATMECPTDAAMMSYHGHEKLTRD